MPELSLSLITQIFTQISVGLLGLGFLVLIHEGGHFFMAKAVGVKVNKFSIGFGRTLFSVTHGGTEYCIKAIPFGGFVAMAGEQPEDERSGEENEFSSKPVPHRMAIALSGPLVNIIFAFLTMTALYMIGVQEPISNEIPVGIVEEGSPAEIAGIQPGDIVVELKGKAVTGIEDFIHDIFLENNQPLPIVIRRDTVLHNLTITPVMHEMGFAWVGLTPGQSFVRVVDIMPDMPASKAGFRNGDRISAVEGIKVGSNQTFIDMIDASRGKELSIEVLRDSVPKLIKVSPVRNESDGRYYVGMHIGMVYNTPTHIVHRDLNASLNKSFETNIKFSLTVFQVLSGLFKGQVKLKALSGPVGILQVIGNSFRQSFQKFVEFLALISLNLGIVNLLPLIITDGGVILFLLLEAIRRKPLSLKTQMIINQAAISLFIVFALFITFHDILKIPMFLD